MIPSQMAWAARSCPDGGLLALCGHTFTGLQSVPDNPHGANAIPALSPSKPSQRLLVNPFQEPVIVVANQPALLIEVL
jgi:hypothetical protein